jgi:two-component system LytT family response regulator
MSKIRTLLIDDDEATINLLKIILEQHCPNVEIIECCTTPQDALVSINNLQPDLVFADIEMPGLNAFELLEQVNEVNFDVVFVTAHDEYMMKAFKYSAVDYLVKPPKVDELKMAIKRVADKRKSNVTHEQLNELIKQFKNTNKEKPRLALNTHEKIFFVNIDDIVRCEASGVYTIFHIKDGKKHMVSKNIQKYEEILEEHGFYRPHRSHIINLSYVKEFIKDGDGYLLMADGSKVDVSRYRKDEILKKLGK